MPSIKTYLRVKIRLILDVHQYCVRIHALFRVVVNRGIQTEPRISIRSGISDKMPYGL